MYINGIHIIAYLLIGFFGVFIGQVVGLLNERFANHEKIFSKATLRWIKINGEPHYMLMTITGISYIVLLYVLGFDKVNIYANIDLISYMVLIPTLISIFIIDYKYEIIPNRLVINLLEIGLISTFANGILNQNGTSIAIDRIAGLLAGSGIFLVITLIGGLIAGKEAMGMGDVKLVGVLGLFFGVKRIIMISVISFLVGAVLSIVIILLKKKKPNEYIPFGPFIVCATFVNIYIPEAILFNSLWWLFSGEWFIKILNK